MEVDVLKELSNNAEDMQRASLARPSEPTQLASSATALRIRNGAQRGSKGTIVGSIKYGKHGQAEHP